MAARPPTSCQCGCPHAALIPIYWNRARPFRLPLPIIPCVNDTDVSLRWIRGKELNARRRVERWNVVGLMNFAYAAICDYGFGLGRVVAIWSVHILLGAAALFASKIAQSTEGEAGARGVSGVLCDALLALFLSFGNAHGFLDLNRKFLGDALKEWENGPWFEGVGALQTVFGVIILFFLILTIRNRFRMR